MKFLIQTVVGDIVHDFSFALIRSIEYHNWLHPDTHSYVLSDIPLDIDYDCVPCGDISFMQHYLGVIKPLNVPESLFKYAGRTIINGTDKDIVSTSFVKSNDVLKRFTEVTDTAPPGNYQISSLIDIESEYRCFVYNKKLVGIHYYSGDFTIFPDISTINNMISDFNYDLPYTLDVAVLENKETVIVETHNLYSCGTYGFSDLRIYPKMLIESYRKLKYA